MDEQESLEHKFHFEALLKALWV